MKIFKYFSKQEYLESFLIKGKIRFNSLSYFISCEDKARRDNTENMSIYKPIEGLQITRNNNERLIINGSFISRVKNPHRIFVFCTSTEYSECLWNKFNAAGCVEIFDLEEFTKKIRIQFNNPLRPIKNKQLLSGAVEYYDSESEPNTRYACPDQIIMCKPKEFLGEKEYRFAFAKNKDAFGTNNTHLSIETALQPSYITASYLDLTLGNLADICKIVRYN